MTRLDDDEPTVEEVKEAARRMPREVLPYASKLPREAPPFDWGNSIRQVVFAAGLGFIAGAITDVGWSNAWTDNEVLWIGFGAAMVALALPWPGRIGRRRER